MYINSNVAHGKLFFLLLIQAFVLLDPHFILQETQSNYTTRIEENHGKGLKCTERVIKSRAKDKIK